MVVQINWVVQRKSFKGAGCSVMVVYNKKKCVHTFWKTVVHNIKQRRLNMLNSNHVNSVLSVYRKKFKGPGSARKCFILRAD